MVFRRNTLVRIAVIGSGIVGKATGSGLEAKGHDVVFYDINSIKLMQLAQEGYRIATSVREAVKQSDVSMICAPTQTIDGSIDRVTGHTEIDWMYEVAGNNSHWELTCRPATRLF